MNIQGVQKPTYTQIIAKEKQENPNSTIKHKFFDEITDELMAQIHDKSKTYLNGNPRKNAVGMGYGEYWCLGAGTWPNGTKYNIDFAKSSTDKNPIVEIAWEVKGEKRTEKIEINKIDPTNATVSELLALNAYMDNPPGDLDFTFMEAGIDTNFLGKAFDFEKKYNYLEICEKGADKYLGTGYIGSAKNFISVLDIIKTHMSKSVKGQENIFDMLA